MADWCILRVSGKHTLRLAQSLREDGFEAWTPIEAKRIRVPRIKAYRDIVLPIMPSYVFAKAQHLVDLLQMAALPFKPRRAHGKPAHVDFSVMHHHDSIPLIGDDQLQSLRKLEAKRAPKAKAEALPAGVEVRVKMEGGSFAGMRGKVEKSDSGFSLVCFDNRITVKIPTYLLDSHALQHNQPAARRAA